MPLQGRRTGSADYGRWIKALIAGSPGAGKTLISSTFPNVVYASAEAGLMSVADRDVVTFDIRELDQLKELHRALDQVPDVRAKMVGKLIGAGDTPADTVVIDTVDEVARITQKERLTETKKESLAQADWGWYGDQLRGILRSFRNLNMHVIFTCHIKTTEDSETGQVLVNPAIQGQVGDELPAYVDLALLLTARPMTEVVNGQSVRRVVRFLQTYPDGRHRWIKDRSGKLPMEFPVDFETDYKRMDEYIYGTNPQMVNDVQEMAEQLATPAPVAAPAAVQTVPEAPVPVAPPAPAPAPAQQPVPQVADAEATPGQPKEQGAAESVPETGTAVSAPSTLAPTAPAGLVCESCSGAIESEDQRDLSQIRFRRDLCRKCFSEAKSAKK